MRFQRSNPTQVSFTGLDTAPWAPNNFKERDGERENSTFMVVVLGGIKYNDTVCLPLKKDIKRRDKYQLL